MSGRARRGTCGTRETGATPSVATRTEPRFPKTPATSDPGALRRQGLGGALEERAHAREAGLDVGGGDGADRQAHPARLLVQSERLEGDDREAGLLEQELADLLVRADRRAAHAVSDEVELH